MKHDELKSIWKEAGGKIDETKNWDVDLHRKQTSDRISKAISKGMVLEIVLKFIIASGAFVLLMSSDFNKSYLLFTVISVLFLIFMIATSIYSKKSLAMISPDLPVLENLEKKMEFMRTSYKPYQLSSAFTPLMMVLTAYCYYFHFKYGEMRFNDPVILIFLALAFIVGLVAQQVVYKIQTRELEETIAGLDEIKARHIEKTRKKRRDILIILIIINIIVLIVLLLLF